MFYKKINNQRKVLFIDPAFQKSFIGYTIAMAGLIVGVTYGAVWLFFWKFESTLKELAVPKEFILYQYLDSQRDTMNFIFILLSLAVVGILVAYGMYFSNRIAGPIYHLKNHLRKHRGTGHIPPLHFRKKDYFLDLATAVNEVIVDNETHKRTGTDN